MLIQSGNSAVVVKIPGIYYYVLYKCKKKKINIKNYKFFSLRQFLIKDKKLALLVSLI